MKVIQFKRSDAWGRWAHPWSQWRQDWVEARQDTRDLDRLYRDEFFEHHHYGYPFGAVVPRYW